MIFYCPERAQLHTLGHISDTYSKAIKAIYYGYVHALLFQAPCQIELEEWINSIHSACAAAFARHRGKTGTLHLLQEEIYRLEKGIESVSTVSCFCKDSTPKPNDIKTIFTIFVSEIFCKMAPVWICLKKIQTGDKYAGIQIMILDFKVNFLSIH